MSEVEIARKYLNKGKNCKDRGVSFELSFSDYKRLLKIKKCQYTGLVLTEPEKGIEGKNKASDRTLDRLDSSVGYTKGNTYAVCHFANKLKSSFENSNNDLGFNEMSKMATKIKKLGGMG